MPTPSSLRLPQPLLDRIRDRAIVERRSFAGTCRVLLERGLAVAEAAEPEQAEVERLARLCRRVVNEQESWPS